MDRCVNIDWLEVHCLEPNATPRTAEYFRSLGLEVVEREYGTRVYKKMFTILFDDGQPFIEVRREPFAQFSDKAKIFFEPNSVHLRLHNRTCYFSNAVQLMQDFINRHGYEFRRISRIDIAYDFEYFDSGDNPKIFLERYLKKRFVKINQGNISTHGYEDWDTRDWNSISWGNKKSPVFTRFYNKTLEIKQKKDKPYIRQVWAHYGLVDDFIQLTKQKNGVWYQPDIWRVEFQVTSAVRNWITYDVDEQGHETHNSVRNTLECYDTPDKLWHMFSSLAAHYFHFKRYIAGKRKDRCDDKVLFRFGRKTNFCKVEYLASSTQPDASLQSLRNKLEKYKSESIDPNIHTAANIILEQLDKQIVRYQAARPWNETEVELLRKLIAYRVNNNSTNPLTLDKAHVEAMIAIERDLFKEE